MNIYLYIKIYIHFIIVDIVIYYSLLLSYFDHVIWAIMCPGFFEGLTVRCF